MIYDTIKKLSKEKGISINQLEKILELSKGSLCRIDMNRPSIDRLQRIADFFGVSLDYLMTGKEKRGEQQPELELSNVYFSLAKEAEQNGIDPRDIKMAIEMLKKIREEEKNK